MKFEEFYRLAGLVLPPILTVAFLWVAIRLFHERPAHFFLGFFRELLGIFDTRLTLRGLNLIGALIMLILTLLAFAEGLLDTVFEAVEHSRAPADLSAYKASLRYGVIFFFGLYFLISIAIARREP